MKSFQKICLYLFRICAALSMLVAALLLIAYLILKHDPQRLVGKYIQEFSQRAGYEVTFASIDVTLLPLPSVALAEARFEGGDLRGGAAWLTVRPNFWRLFTGDFVPGKIVLLRPRLEGGLPQNAGAFMNIASLESQKRDSTSAITKKEFVPFDCQLDITQGSAQLKVGADTELILNGLDCQIEFSSGEEASGWLHVPFLRAMKEKKILFSLENFETSGNASLANFLADSHGLEASGRFSLAAWLKNCQFKLAFESSSSGWSLVLDTTADLAPDAATSIPAGLSGRITRVARTGEISARGLEWRLAGDSGRLEAICALPANPAEFAVEGTMLVHRLSLPQWFGFARNLSAGIQLSLDNITAGRVDFRLNAKSLKLPRLEATCNGSRFTGNGAVADLAKPVIAIEMNTARANLGLDVPETLGKAPRPPYFPFVPLTPMPGTPLRPGETAIGYDIKLGCAELVYGSAILTNAKLRIYPGKMDKSGLEDVLLSASADVYGGKIKSDCILGGAAGPPLSISASASGINCASLAKIFPAFPARQGRLGMTAALTSNGKDLAPFLANLKGTLTGTGEGISLKGMDGKNPFASLEIKSAIRSASLGGDGLAIDAKWNMSGANADLSFNGSMDGKALMANGMSDLILRSLPADFRVKLKTSIFSLPKDTEIKIRGNASLRAKNGVLELAGATLEIPGATLRGNWRVDPQKPSWGGTLAVNAPDMKNLARRLGFATGDNHFPGVALKFEADFAGQPDLLNLSRIRGSLGGCGISGKIGWKKQAGKSGFDIAIEMDNFDYAKFFGGSKSTRSGKWNFNFMRDFDASGQLVIKNMNIWNMRLKNARFPFSLRGGRLTLEKASANCYGGKIQGSGEFVFSNVLNIQSSVNGQHIDLGLAAKDHDIKARLTGIANIEARINARLTSPGQMPGALNGSWNFSASNGSWRGTDKNGRPAGRLTEFSKVSASGKMDAGVLKSGNFTMEGNGLSVTGGGWLNLASQKLDCEFNVNMKGLPDFPLRLYGSLENSKTSIGAGKMMLNAIGGITSGFVNILGDVAKGALNLFR